MIKREKAIIYISIYPDRYYTYEDRKSSVVLKLGSTTRSAAERAREIGGMASFSHSVELMAWNFSISSDDKKHLENIENGLRREITDKRKESNINYNFYDRENFIVDYSQVESFLNFVENLLQQNKNNGEEDFPKFSKVVEFDDQRKKFLKEIPKLYEKNKEVQQELLYQIDIDPYSYLMNFNKYFSESLPDINELGYLEWKESQKKPTKNQVKLFKDEEEPKYYYDDVLTSSISRIQRKPNNSMAIVDKDKDVTTLISEKIENTPKIVTTSTTIEKNDNVNISRETTPITLYRIDEIGEVLYFSSNMSARRFLTGNDNGSLDLSLKYRKQRESGDYYFIFSGHLSKEEILFKIENEDGYKNNSRLGSLFTLINMVNNPPKEKIKRTKDNGKLTRWIESNPKNIVAQKALSFFEEKERKRETKAVVVFEKESFNIVMRFNSALEAGNYYNVSKTSINEYCNRRTPVSMTRFPGLDFRYKEDYDELVKGQKENS